MKRRARAWVSLVILSALAVLVMGASATSTSKLTKQTGGSTGDSVTAAADTSDAVFLTRGTTAFFVVAANDSNTIYTTQVSADSTNWFTIDTDTVSAGTAEATADFGATYAGFYTRVIQDMIPAGGAAYGAAWAQVAK